MTSTRQGDDPQTTFDEISVVNQDLARACANLDMDAAAHKRYVKNARYRADAVKAMEGQIREVEGFEESGARIRVRLNEEDPGYVLVIGGRNGGGFDVPEWTSVGVRSQSKG